MTSLVKSEFIKGRHSFARKSLVLFPLFIALMAVVLMGGEFTQIGAFNWWSTILLPTVAALVCIHLTAQEKRQQFFNVSVLPAPKARVWVAKVLAGCGYLLAANLIVFGITTITGAFFGAQYPVWRGIAAALALTLSWAWQVPLCLFLAARFNASVALIGTLFVNLGCSIQTIAGGKLWFIPFAIPARLMAAILGVNPNGVPMEADSPLHDPGVILPALLITAVLFLGTLAATTTWFDRRSD